MVSAPPKPTDRCTATDHQAFHVSNIDGIRLCATCWHRHGVERASGKRG